MLLKGHLKITMIGPLSTVHCSLYAVHCTLLVKGHLKTTMIGPVRTVHCILYTVT